jgi:NTP pyrophosphatase (non-canonical NTP hydrolase)
MNYMEVLTFKTALQNLKNRGIYDEDGIAIDECAEFTYLTETLEEMEQENSILIAVPSTQQDIVLVFQELQHAQEKHPNWPNSGFEALAIVTEEVGELAKAILQFKHEGGDPERIRQEAIQVAAMGMRYVLNLPEITKPNK